MNLRRAMLYRLLSDQLHFTAAHEAGHAVAAWASPFVLKIISLTVVPNDECGGLTQYSTIQHDWQEPFRLFDKAIICLAGLAATLELTGRASTKFAKSDINDAVTRCRELEKIELTSDWRLNPPPLADIKPFRLEPFISPTPSARTAELLALASRHARSRLRQFEDEFWRVYDAAVKCHALDAHALAQLLGPRPWMPWNWIEQKDQTS